MSSLCYIIIVLASQFCAILVCATSAEDTAGCHSTVDATSCGMTCEYTDWASDSNCRDSNLDQVPCECAMTENLDLRNNVIEVLHVGSFKGYGKLRQLDLEFNQITNITKGTFRDCGQLLKIYLQFNYLTEIMGGAFEGAQSLDYLFLNQNSIGVLHPGAFDGLSRLTRLYMGYNLIAEFPDGVFAGTTSLQYLHVGDNSLGHISPGDFDSLINLKYLNLKNNNLKAINGDTFNTLTNLQELDLSGNLIISISNFPTLPKLKILDFYDNQIEDINELSDAVEGLEELYVADNPIDCTCSVNPIREWIISHSSDVAVETDRANATCITPNPLEGQALCSVTRERLCPGTPHSFFTNRQRTTVIPGYPQQTAISKYKPNNLPTPHNQGQSSKKYNIHSVTYVTVGACTFVIIVLVLCILVRFLNSRNRRYETQYHAAKQRPVVNKPSQLGQRPLSIIVNNHPHYDDDDDDQYEPVNRPHSPTEDSAFGSQGNLDELQDETDEARPGLNPYPTYMSLDAWNGPPANTPQPPIQEIPNATPLESEQPTGYVPYGLMLSREAVPNSEQVNKSRQLSTAYVPHTVFNHLPLGNRALRHTIQQSPKHTILHSIMTAGTTPDKSHINSNHATQYIDMKTLFPTQKSPICRCQTTSN